MNLAIKDVRSPVEPNYVFDLLAIGDSKVAFSSWCFATVFNGRSVADFATLLALGSTSLGHARALYQHLVDYGYDYNHLERGRMVHEINSMQLFDQPPACWEDLMATILVAESAFWAISSGFVGGADSQIGMLMQKIEKERYFHVMYATGWIGAFDQEERERFRACLDRRTVVGRQWLGPVDTEDSTYQSGFRTLTNRRVHELFDSGLTSAYEALGTQPPQPAALPANWDRTRRRIGSVPDGLFRHMKPREL